jgi:hypothetical protein
MTNRYTEFLVAATGTPPRSLTESIRQVGNASAGFCRSWLCNDIPDALATSEEAFELLDHIQNEVLRHRDEKKKAPGWAASSFKQALDTPIGDLLDLASPADKAFFLGLTAGNGAMPPNASLIPLTLETSLNKLKHRGTKEVNFMVSPQSGHLLYIFTYAGQGKPDTISGFNIQAFCSACKMAALAI